MSTIAGVRRHLSGRLQAIADRTGMYVSDARQADAVCWTLIDTLAHVDDRCDTVSAHVRAASAADFGAVGPPGVHRWCTDGHLAAAEVVAWWCQVAARFHWLRVARLDEAAWQELGPDDLVRFSDGTWTRARIESELPAASLTVDRRVYCFAPPDPEDGWMFLDVLDAFGPPWHRPEAALITARGLGNGRMIDRLVRAATNTE